MTSRSTLRTALAALLQAALVGTGKAAQAVYSYPIGDFQGQSPVVVVESGGSERRQMTHGSQGSRFFLTIYIFVLYSDQSTFQEDDAETALDSIETTIAETLAANRATANWGFIDFGERSRTDYVAEAGVLYRRETIPVEVRVYGG